MRTRSVLLTLAGLLALVPQAEAQFSAVPLQHPSEEYAVAFDLLYWRPTPDLLITDDAVVTPAPVDFVQTFGLEDDRFRELRVTVKPARKHKLRVSYLPVRYEQTARLDTDVRFGGQSFVVNTDATTDIDWVLWRAGYEYDIVVGTGGFVGVIGEVKYTDLTVAITNGQRRADTTVQVPVPTVGGIARGYLGAALSVTAELTGFSLDRDHWRGQFVDLDVYGTLDFGGVNAQVGYRSMSVEYRVDDHEGDLAVGGVYVGLTLRF